MEEYQEGNYRQQNQEGNSSIGGGDSASRWLGLAVIALLVVSGVGLGYAYHQRITVRDLEAQASASNSIPRHQSRLQNQSPSRRIQPMLLKIPSRQHHPLSLHR